MGWLGIALVAGVRTAAAVGLLLFLYPNLLLPSRPGWSRADRLAATCMVGMGVMVATGHLMVWLHMFEILGLVMLLTAIALAMFRLREGAGALRRLAMRIARWAVHLMDIMRRSRPWISPAKAPDQMAAASMAAPAQVGWNRAAIGVLTAAVLAAALYSRFTFALQHPAPAFSDYLEMLQWTKWLSMSGYSLFPDWVYPKGMNLLYGVLGVLSQENPHVALRVGGPLLSLLTLAGIWYAVSSATDSPVAGLMGAALWAFAPGWLPTEWSRQAGTLPQEFAMMLLLPAAWWAFRHISRGDPLDRWLVAAAAFVVAASHWVVLLYLAVALVAAAAVGLRDRVRRTAWLAVWVGGATLAGLAPQGIALLRGIPILSTAAGFITSGDATEFFLPLSLSLLLLLLGVALLSLIGIHRQGGRLLLIPAVVLAFVLVHYHPLFGINSPALAVRSGDFVALGVTAAFGSAFAGVEWLVLRGKHLLISAVCGIVAVGLAWWQYPPPLLVPDLQLTDEITEQVLEIDRSNGRLQWLVVSRPELLALILGRGMQVDGTRFAQEVPVPSRGVSAAQSLVAHGFVPAGTKAEETPQLFFIVENDPFISVAAHGVGKAESIRAENGAVAEWVRTYSLTHDPPEIWYQSPTLTIYHLPPPER